MRRLRTLAASVIVVLLAAGLSGAALLLVAQQTADVAAPRVDERVTYVTAAASDLSDRIASLRSATEELAATLPGPSSAQVDDRLTAAVGSSAVLDGAYVIELSGSVVAAAAANAALVGLSRGEGVGSEALSGGTVVSGVVEDPLEREPSIQVGVPVGDGPTGALVGIALLEEGGGLLAELDEVAVPGGASLALVGPDGTVLRPGTDLDPIPRAGPNLGPPARAASGGPGWLEYPGEADVARVAAYAPVTDGWSLVVHQDAASFSPAAEGYRAAVAAAPAVLALAALLVGLFLVQGARVRRSEREADAAKRAFLAVTGHELRTPLTVMSGMLQTLVSRSDAIAPEMRQEALRTVARHTRHLERLIERIILAGHLEAGVSSSISTREVDLVRPLTRAAEDVAARSPGHDIETEIASPLPADADPRAVEQAVAHLLDNAVRYSPGGGLIRVTGQVVGRKVVIAVEDEGVGLPADASAIFDRFVQGEEVDTRLRDEGGVGLGLHIVRHLVHAMGGSVRAERRQRGARFVIELSVAARPRSV